MRSMQGCLLRLLVILSALGVVTVGLGIVFLYQLHDLDPQGWDQGVGQWLKIKVASAAPLYKLSEEEAKAAATHGLNAELVARASAAEAWADEQWGAGAGDRALYIALTSGESGGCQNCGKCLAMAEYRKHAVLNEATQGAALRKFVEIWKKHDIRTSNPIAAKYIPEDYNIEGIIGSCGGGALGCSQFIPTTALIHLEEIGEPFDLWDPNTAARLMAAELHRLGWNKNANLVTKAKVLLGWNRHYGWVSGIAQTADQIRAYMGARSGLASIGWLGEEQSGWQGTVASVLESLGLMPNIEVLAAATVTAVEGELPTGEGPVALDLLNEVPQNDGEKYNVITWAKSNPRIELQPQEVWDFCAQTNTTGWLQYRFAAGINAGGICFNASMLRELAEADERLKATLWYPHSKTKWGRLHTVIACPGVSFKLQNISDQVLTIVWSQDGDQLFVSVEENEENGS